MSEDLRIWGELSKAQKWELRRHSFGLHTNLTLNNNNNTHKHPNNFSRDYYVNKYLIFREQEKRKEEQRKQAKKTEIRDKRRKQSATVLKAFCFGKHSDFLAIICLILQTLFVVLKLDGIFGPETGWALLLIPTYILMAQMVLAPLLFDSISSYFGVYTFERELIPSENHCSGSLFCYSACVYPFTLSDPQLRVIRPMIYVTVGCLFLFLALMSAKVSQLDSNGNSSSEDGLKWWIVFLPLILLSLIFTSMPLWYSWANTYRLR